MTTLNPLIDGMMKVARLAAAAQCANAPEGTAPSAQVHAEGFEQALRVLRAACPLPFEKVPPLNGVLWRFACVGAEPLGLEIIAGFGRRALLVERRPVARELGCLLLARCGAPLRAGLARAKSSIPTTSGHARTLRLRCEGSRSQRHPVLEPVVPENSIRADSRESRQALNCAYPIEIAPCKRGATEARSSFAQQALNILRLVEVLGGLEPDRCNEPCRY
jgi:hypothetical protein